MVVESIYLLEARIGNHNSVMGNITVEKTG